MWNDLAVQYQAKADSNNVIETYKQMLRVAPTNEALRKEAFKLFQNYGRPDAAEEVADEGLKIDDKNADFWDLKANACLDEGQSKPEKNRCAVDALEKVLELNPSKGDSASFWAKITFGASQPLTKDSLAAKDTVRFLKYARIGVTKFPTNGQLLPFLAEAYSLAGPVDSAVSATKQLMAVDSSDLTPVLRIAKSLADAKRGREALALAPYVERLGNADNKGNMGAILARGAFPFLQPPSDWSLAADMAREVLKLAPAASQTAKVGNFVLGISAFQMVADLDKEATSTKSCPMAQQMKALLDEAAPAMTAGRDINPGTIDPRLASMTQFLAHVNSQIKAYCK